MELALAFPLLVMLLVGMVSAAIAYNHQLALTHAAREGGRYAATLPVSNFSTSATPMADWLEEVITQVVDDATGTLAVGVPGRYVCVAYVHPNGAVPEDQTARRILDSSGLNGTELGQQCYASGDGRPDSERRVQVVVARDTDFSVALFATTVNLDAEAVNRFEAALGA